MTVKERVYASRLIEKAQHSAAYMNAIGISYMLKTKTRPESRSSEKKESK